MDDQMTRIVDRAYRPRAVRALGRGLPAVAVLGLTALLAATGCSTGQQKPAAAPPTTAASIPATPTTPPSTGPTTGSASGDRADGTDLRDGRHPALVRRVDAAGRRITVDVIQLYFGAAADRAALEDHASEIPPANDYWIRNVSTRLRTLPVAPGAHITVNVHGALESGNSTTDVRKTLDQFGGIEHLDTGVFWLTLSDGRVTRIAEQYLP